MQENLLNHYMNELATANHIKLSLLAENDMLKQEIEQLKQAKALLEIELSELKQSDNSLILPEKEKE